MTSQSKPMHIRAKPLPPMIIRDATSDDLPLIVSNWRKGAYNAVPNRLIPWPVYFQQASQRIKRALETASVKAAVHPADPSEAYGFLVYQPKSDGLVIDWLYVKSIWRGRGIAAALLDETRYPWRTSPIQARWFSDRHRSLSERFNLIYLPEVLS